MKRLVLSTLFSLSIGFSGLSAENTNFESVHFSGSGNCAQCHNGMRDENGEDVSIVTDWSSSMMANSAKDPLWRAKVKTEINRNPHLESVINDKCTKCHMPMANTEAHFSGANVEIFGSGFTNPDNQYHDAALNGVSCTLCHQILDNGKLGTAEGGSGNYEIGQNKIIYGPYDNVNGGPMRNNVGYDIQYSAHTKDSKLCASCHDLKTPYVDENGNVLSTTKESEFPEQMPYSEWEHSEFKDTKSCQDCHMERTNGAPIASRPRWVGPRDNFAKHYFVGANKTMLDILNNNKAALGVNSNNFAETLAKTDEMLRGAASIQVLSSSLNDGLMRLEFKVNSDTGHKLPTSFPSRRAFLHVKVTNDAGQVVFESGKVNADGSIVGADSDTDRTTYEPHYDLITSEDQVQIYEPIMGNNLGEVTYTLLRGMMYKKDNRILPRGFDKTTAHSDVAVAGNAMTDDNFVGGSDTIEYQIAGLDSGTYSVEVELLYQTVGFGFLQDLYSDTSTEVNTFKTMYTPSDMKTSQIASASANVTGSGGTATEPVAACADGIDNDGDGLVDLSDPGCTDSADNDEFNEVAVTACSDGIDNDGDGLVDLSDPGCTDSADNDEFNEVAVSACSDGIDNDGDGAVDMNDPGCTDSADNDEFNEVAPPAACADGIDNDGDGLVDLSDPGCTDSADTDEFNEVLTQAPTFECNDGIDNDGDGLVDMADNGCRDPEDNSEWRRRRD